MIKRAGAIVTLLCFMFASFAAQAVVIQFQGGNPVAGADAFTDFSTLTPTGGLSDPMTFDGFTLDQVNGDTNGIWTTYNPGGGTGLGWYPNGGDSGYTQIVLASGADFVDVGLFVGSGNGGHNYLAYQLLNNGIQIAAGVLSGHQTPFHWLAITGGGFDTINLRDGNNGSIAIGDGSHNALAFDKIAATVPAPLTLSLFAIGLLGLARVRKARSA